MDRQLPCHPISEVLIDKAYKGLGTLLLSDGQRRQPLLYSVGFGSQKSPNLLRLTAEGWRWVFIPFWAKVVRPAVFLRQIAFLRKTAARRLLLDRRRCQRYRLAWAFHARAGFQDEMGLARFPGTPRFDGGLRSLGG